MRTGMNPMRGKQIDCRPGIVISAIVHLPNNDGYHRDRMKVVKLCLESMRDIRHADMECEVLVWDNGSSPEMRNWLERAYKPDYLILSKNIGKINARTAILRMFNPETIVGISDDDMFFYPEWLSSQVEILETYPNVGVVSGYPVVTQFRWGCTNTVQWAIDNKDVAVKRGKFITSEWDYDFCTSIGREYEFQKEYTVNDYQMVGSYKGVDAFLTGHHCQFICYAGRILPFAIWDNLPMADEKPFDNAIDNAGLLRLTTRQRYTRHIGNALDPSITRAAQRHGL